MEDTVKPSLEPSIIVIFGITGDLSQRYLLPALYHLFKDGLLHEHTEIVGLTRQAMTADELFGKVELCINEVDNICDPVALKRIISKTQLFQFDPNNSDDYPKLLEHLNAIEATHGVCMNRLYYLSIPPKVFAATVQNLGKAGLNGSCEHGNAKTRLLVEKPFGYDLASAETLIKETNEVFAEEQVFRIDHYLAKETVQNILTFRHNNPIFADIWNNQHIASIDIIASEKIGIENRVNFYEGVGALRDLIQSHLLQLLAVTTMDLPSELDNDSIHAARQALLEAVVPADPAEAIRGQYDTYKQEVGNPDSTTETYARINLRIDTERWRNVALSITTGKALQEKHTEITLTFTSPADKIANVLTFRIHPNEGIHVQLRVKKPGFDDEVADAAMDFSYKQTFGGDSTHPDAYERVLVDAVKGDRTLFSSSREVLASWRIIEPIIQAWRDTNEGIATYASGSAGPNDEALVQ
jgi:glucose-6-phosphate 1-dehydrogenase